MPRRPSPTDHLDAVREKMGTLPDHEVALLCNSTAAIVGRYRRKHGIKAYQGYKFIKGARPPGAKTSTSGTRRVRKSKLDPYREEVGKLPDKVLAEKAGVSIEGVRMYRKRHGIALEPSARQPRGRKAKKAPAAATAVVATAAAPKRRKRRSKLDPFRDALGVRPDRELAEKAGVSLQAVRQYRRRHDIAAPPRGVAAAAPAAAEAVAPAPAPAPAAAAKPSKHFGYSVSVRTKDGEEIYFLVATDIIVAATQASQSAVGRVISIKQLGPALA